MKSIKRILYRAMHVFKKSLLSSKVTKSVFCLLLTLSLVLGTGVNLSYAAEILPEGPEGVTISQTDNQVIVAPSARGGASATYEWQMYSPNLNDFVLIGGATDSTLNVNYALVNNALNGENKTTIRCNVKDQNGEVISSKDYNVSYNEPEQSIDEQVKQAAIDNAVSSMSFSTNYANGQANEENADTVKITIEYVDENNPDRSLGLSHEQIFSKSQPFFDWNVMLRSSIGHISTDEQKFLYSPEVQGLIAEYRGDTDPLYPNSVYVRYSNNNVLFPQTIDEVTIKVKFVLTTANYYVHPIYEKVDGSFDETVEPQLCSAAIGSSIPDEDTINKLATDVYLDDPKGWTASKFKPMILSTETATLTNPDGGTPIELKFNRSWTLCYFNLNGGSNGPAAVYVRHGANFKEVLSSSWPNGYPTQIPTRDKYTCTGWKANGEEPEIPVNTDFGVVPGEDTEYVAQWKLSLPVGQKVSVTIAYYCEKANDTSYEYLIERYDQVDQNMIGNEENPYTIPAQAGASDPYLDRRFPQERTKKSTDADFNQYELKNPSVIETVDGSPNMKYNQLFKYDHCDPVVVAADGSAVCKVYLNRVKFTYNFYNRDTFTGTINWTINAKWDQDISSVCGDINSAQTNGQSRFRPWKVKSTSETAGSNYECCYISNMGFYDESFCIITTYSASWKAHLYYYLQKPGTDWDIQTNPSLSYFYGWSTDSYDNFDRIDVSTNAGATTTKDEFINILGFKTPTPRGQSTEGDAYIGGPNIINAGETYHPNSGRSGYSTETNNKGAHIGSWDYLADNASNYRRSHTPASDHNGLKYFYKRNKHQLYLRNIYGVEKSDYHVDLCAQITTADDDGSANEGGVHYELPISDFVIQNTEEQHLGQNDGLTGITKDTEFLKYIPGTGQTPGINDRPPSTVDQHLVFEGWYEDPAFSIPVTHYDYKTGVHTVVNDWKMPNHEQDLYAHWVSPDRKIQFNVPKFDGTTDEYKYTSEGKETIPYLDNMSDYEGEGVFPTKDELETLKSDHPAYRFIGYYYYASEEDMKKIPEPVKTFFDPTKMQMPWCDWSELDATNDDNPPTIVVHQYWEAEKDVDFETRFVLDDGTNQTLVADTMIGRDRIHTTVTVNALDPDTSGDAFKADFRGIIELKNPSETTQDITLESWSSGPNPNVATFYYKYKEGDEYNFKYKIQHWCHEKDTAEDSAVKTWESEEFTTPNHSNVVSINPDNHPKAAPGTKDPQLFSLLSPKTITTTLQLNTTNIIKIYYSEVEPVHFNFKIATIDFQDQAMANIVGGKIEKQTYDGPNYEPATCWAEPNPAFNIKWYYSNASGDSYDPTKPVSDEWIVKTSDSKQVTLYAPSIQGVYTEGATYWAVFKEQAPVDIYYKAQTVNNSTDLTAVDYTCGEAVSSGQDAQITHAIVDSASLNGSKAIPGNKAIFIAWAKKNADGTFAIISDTKGVTNFKPSGQTTSDGQGNEYTYFEPQTYYALFYEKAVDITYKVIPEQTDFGNIQVTGKSITDVDTESVFPHESETAVGATAIPNKYYHFVNWTVEGSAVPVSTELKFVPEKPDGGVFSSITYIANFAENDPYKVEFITDGNGTIENDSVVNIVGGATFDVLSTNAIKLNSLNLEHDGALPVPNDGMQFDKWTIWVNGVESDISTLSTNELNSNVTFEAYFKPIVVPPTPPTPDPDNPVIVNVQTGDSNFWIIIGLIAIVVVAGGVTYVVARKKRNNVKPKHK